MKMVNLTVLSVCAIAGMTTWLILAQDRPWSDQISSSVKTPSGVKVISEIDVPKGHQKLTGIEAVGDDATFAFYELLPELERLAGPILEPADLKNAPPEILQQEAELLILQADKLVSDLGDGSFRVLSPSPDELAERQGDAFILFHR